MGCYNCRALEQTLFDALAELDLAAAVESVTDPVKIKESGIIGLPALIINGKTKVSGRVPSKEEIKRWIRTES
jgi:predicted DsbA family dithiol-disulfide isomerase